jgi:DUF4097 and DUF4098 domain-containing protein YvlB
MRAFQSWRQASLSLCLTVLLTAVGCDIRSVHVGSWGQKKYEKTTSHQTPFAPGSTLDVDTSSGSITVTGTDAAGCDIIARITGYAPTEEEAQELAEQVEIKLDQAGSTLRVRADKPTLGNNRGISISYTITVPRQATVQCRSAYGSLSVAGIEGAVSGKTSSGSIEAESIRGTTRLDTSYGSISCREIVGEDVTLRSSSGSITAANVEGSARMESSYGSVTCEGFSGGDLTLKSSSGRIAVSNATFGTCDANTSYGPAAGSNLKGRLIKFHSSSGNIDISDSDAPSMDLSTSYGRVDARQIVTGDLKAGSGSGSVDVVCAPACPPGLIANVKSSYGSVTFTAPARFAGRVTLSTNYGSVQTDLPVTITGKIGDKKKIDGTIGAGTGMLHLETSSGSVTLK